MSTSFYISLAKKYVELSNKQELEQIFEMFAATASYTSESAGSANGLIDIISLIENFYREHPDVCWEVDEYEETTPRWVEFDFIRSQTNPENGGVERQRGREIIEFTKQGLIKRIKVQQR